MHTNIILDQLEYVHCNLCGHDDTKIVTHKSRFNIDLRTVICKNCGLIYHNPRMTLMGFSKFYVDDYRMLIGHKTKVEELFQLQVRHGEDIIAFLNQSFNSNHRILDIGCGPGGHLYSFQAHFGCETVGIEPAKEHVSWANQTKGLNLIPAVLEEVEFQPESFDLVIISQTLNHLLYPLEALKRSHDWLTPSGIIYLEVMDFPYYVELASLELANTVDHPYMFCAPILQTLLKKAGFDIIKWYSDAEHPKKPVDYPGQPHIHMRVIAKKAATAPAIIEYPAYEIILRKIKNNQRRFKSNLFRRNIALAFNRSKRIIRCLIGDKMWNGLRSVQRRKSH